MTFANQAFKALFAIPFFFLQEKGVYIVTKKAFFFLGSDKGEPLFISGKLKIAVPFSLTK